MGWYFDESLNLKRTIAELSEGSLASHFVRNGDNSRGILWTVREITFNREKKRIISCDLIERQNDAWGYKPMDETMGPYYYSCPISYLDIVSEPLNDTAKQWREKVRAYHAKKVKN